MNINDLKAAGEFAQNFGCKALIYGPAGSAKTPLFNTAPRPLLLATEPGLLSMRGSKIPTYEAYTPQRIDEFFKWFFNSNETKNFDTLGIDSASQVADIYLIDAQKNNKHGLKAYGEMAESTMEHLRTLYYTRYKHTYVICKEEIKDLDGQSMRRPYFPGQVLPISVPHLYDFILRLAKTNVPGVQGETLAFQCQGSYNVLSRNRTGNLNQYEPPNFSDLVNKAMSAPPMTY
jgi:AAA domain-containing protein